MTTPSTPTSEPIKKLLFPNEPTRFEGQHLADLFIHCFRLNASDITLQTGEAVFCEIQGRLFRCTLHELNQAEVSELINALYGPNATTQIMRGEDLDTHYEVRPTRRERFRFRINATGCTVKGTQGIQITARTIPIAPPTLWELDVPEKIINNAAPSDGVVYVTGATGSGKSTLLASMIRNIAEQKDGNRKILTYESPIEYVFDTIEMPSSVISQAEIPRHLPSFASGVRNALRRKPHAILVGEARDSETIAAVLEAALTGHPTYTTLHSNGVAETIRRLVGSFPLEDREARTIDIIETVRMIIWQQLVPTVDGKRTALREYLVFDDSLRDKMLNSDLSNITSTTRDLLKSHGQTMQTEVDNKFKMGIISERVHNLLSARNK
jgi:defect in organelle trafficking protein DotB